MLTAFDNYPAEHRIYRRDSVFEEQVHRGAGLAAVGLAVAFKLIEAA